MKTIINNRRNGVCFSRFNNANFFLLAVGAIFSCLPAQAQTDKTWDGLPDPDAPWKGTAKKEQPKKATPDKTQTITTSPVESKPAPVVESKTVPADSMSVPSPTLQATKATKHQVSLSGDYFLGKGDVTLPQGFALFKSGFFPGVNPVVAKPERAADYLGATLSYSYGQSWYLDIGYSQGKSTGNVPVGLGAVDSAFTIDETAYQAYIRYVPSALRGKRLSAYARVGVSYVDSKMTDELTSPLFGFYREDVKATDLLGSVGFGVGYRLFNVGRFRLGLQAEADGFYGNRSQDVTESFPNVPLTLPIVTIDNTLYGGIGRGTIRMEYRFGRSGLLRMFMDAGVQAKYTLIEYPSGTFDDKNAPQTNFKELLWGPYAKLGVSYSF